ncbi:MAG: metal-dependent transcriptional regulator [Treponema sp.]|nr:metal-dependent transcriptional regulator [Treponema sp.]
MKRRMQINQGKYETVGKSKENYLKAILITNEKYGACRAVDISRQLSVSKASASIALKKLEEEGFISREEWRITLTEKGSVIARHIYEKNLFFTEWFENLGVSKENAKVDACKIEHIISDETYQKMKKFVTNQSEV